MDSRLVVLASGSGTLLQALLDTPVDVLGARVVAVVTDRPGVAALDRAAAAGVPAQVVAPQDVTGPAGAGAERAAGWRPPWDRALTDAVAAYAPDWVVSAGFMRILGPTFLDRFGGRILNSHPALLPSFPGAHGVRDALAYGVKVTGTTIHLIDAGVDTGPVIAQEAVVVAPDDDEESLHERIKVVERRLLVDVVARLARDGCTVSGRKVTIP